MKLKTWEMLDEEGNHTNHEIDELILFKYT